MLILIIFIVGFALWKIYGVFTLIYELDLNMYIFLQ